MYRNSWTISWMFFCRPVWVRSNDNLRWIWFVTLCLNWIGWVIHFRSWGMLKLLSLFPVLLSLTFPPQVLILSFLAASAASSWSGLFKQLCSLQCYNTVNDLFIRKWHFYWFPAQNSSEFFIQIPSANECKWCGMSLVFYVTITNMHFYHCVTFSDKCTKVSRVNL